METKSRTKAPGQESGHNAKKTPDPVFTGRFTCGTGPDEEPDNFQAAVRGLTRKGHSGTEAKKIMEACFKALAKI